MKEKRGGIAVMLIVLYCGAKACGHIHIRTDGRKEEGQIFCPKCGNKLTFVCDFRSWTGFGSDEREMVLQMLQDAEEKDPVGQISNPGLYYEIKQMSREEQRLRKENEQLKTRAKSYHETYEGWREKGMHMHDELWALLRSYEPEKYQKPYESAETEPAAHAI